MKNKILILLLTFSSIIGFGQNENILYVVDSIPVIEEPKEGFGYGIGFGGKYSFDKFLIYLNPNFKRHSVVPFEKENYHQKLTEFGIQLGIGYEF